MTLAWSPALVLHHAPMDATHQEFVGLVQAITREHRAGDTSVAMALFRQLLTHTEAHFAQEERWMDEIGYPDPDGATHRRQHGTVLALMRELLWRYETAGRTDQLAVTVEELGRWFVQHATMLDADLARHLEAHGATAPD